MKASIEGVARLTVKDFVAGTARVAREAGMVAVLWVLAASAAAPGCFGGSGRETAAGGGPEIVVGGVVFRYYDPKATRVNLVGDFNEWSPRTDAMVDENGDGEWTLFYDLPAGVYQYKFVVDGTRWMADPKNPEKVSDGFDGQNSVVRVPPR